MHRKTYHIKAIWDNDAEVWVAELLLENGVIDCVKQEIPVRIHEERDFYLYAPCPV